MLPASGFFPATSRPTGAPTTPNNEALLISRSQAEYDA